MAEKTKMCVITREFTAREFHDGTCISTIKGLEAVVGSGCKEGTCSDTRIDLWFDVPTASAKALVDDLNEHEDVSLASYLVGPGKVYPQ